MEIGPDWPELADAIRLRDGDRVESLLRIGGTSVSGATILHQRRRGKGWTPLEYACYRRCAPIVALLVAHGADVDETFQNAGVEETPLSYAQRYGLSDIVAALQPPTANVLQRGAPKSPHEGSIGRSRGQKNKNALNYADLTLGEEIGKGAYGRVVRGTYLDRNVACKVVSMANADEKEQENLKREIQLHLSAKHSCIVEMLGLTRDLDRNLVLVLEYIEGGDLLSLLTKKETTLLWPLRMRMASQVASALSFLHARNTLHRGIKARFL